MNSKRALIVGIDDYHHVPKLRGCVNDAVKIAGLLAMNEDGSPNYDCRLFTTPTHEITKIFLKQKVNELFSNFDGDVLFYFSGHGYLSDVGGYLVSQEGVPEDLGLAMDDIIDLANKHKVKKILLILDCCHSGDLGDLQSVQTTAHQSISELRDGLTILAASRSTETAKEVGGQGIFTELVIGALSGGAADIRGDVSAAAIYAYVEQALGPWDQRPLYKTNANTLPPVRRCNPRVHDELLRELPRLFDAPNAVHQMNPTYEFTEKSSDPRNIEIFNKFKMLRNASLLATDDNEDLYFIALKSKGVKLTALGQFYWRLAKDGRI